MLFQATPPPDEAARRAEEQALLKEELHVAATMTQDRLNSDNIATDLTTSEQEYKQLEQQLNSSVVTSKIPLDECEIGNWKGCWIYTTEEVISQFSPVPSKAHQLMPHSEVEIHSVDFGIEDVTKPFSSGSYDFENRKLIINKFNIDEAVRKLGGIPSLVQTRDQLRILTEVNSLLNLLNTPVSSPIMKASAIFHGEKAIFQRMILTEEQGSICRYLETGEHE